MTESTAARQAKSSGSENEFSSQGTISNVAENIKEKASEFTQRVNDTIDDKRETAASALSDTASRIHQSAESLPGAKMTSIAHRAADKLDQTSQYIREHDTSAMMEDVLDFVKRYPAQAIVGAVVAGFLAGRLLKRG